MGGGGKVVCQWSMVECGRMYPAVDKAGAKACVKRALILQIWVHLKTWLPKFIDRNAAGANWLGWSWVEREVYLLFDACVELPVEKSVVWVPSTKAN